MPPVSTTNVWPSATTPSTAACRSTASAFAALAKLGTATMPTASVTHQRQPHPHSAPRARAGEGARSRPRLRRSGERGHRPTTPGIPWPSPSSREHVGRGITRPNFMATLRKWPRGAPGRTRTPRRAQHGPEARLERPTHGLVDADLGHRAGDHDRVHAACLEQDRGAASGGRRRSRTCPRPGRRVGARAHR